MALGTEKDPFAVYGQAIEERLVAMSEAGAAAPQKALVVPAPSQRQIAPAITLVDFARKFWGGRDAELSAAMSRLERYRPTLEHILE
jgi:hypothetical protein